MGISSYTYLGPFVEYKVRETSVTQDNCPKKSQCPNDMTPFCSRCGLGRHKRFQTVKTYEPSVNLYDDPFDETLWDPYYEEKFEENGGVRIYYARPNIDIGLGREVCWDSRSDSGVHLIDPNCMGEEITKFKESGCAEDLKRLEELVGSENFAIRWGLLIYFM